MMNHQGTLIRFAVPAAVLLYNPIPLFSFLVNESNKSIRLKSLLLNFIVAFDISTSKQCAMTLFNCISKQRRRRMPCTNCMVEYSRTRKEHGCSKCGFGFCERCLPHKTVIPSLSPKPVSVCANCHGQLQTGKANPNSLKEKTRDLPLLGQQSSGGELPPPSLHSLYSQQTKKATAPSSKLATEKNQWADLETRLQKLNEPFEGSGKVENAVKGGRKEVQSTEQLEERLAALRGLPVELIRKPRLLVTNDDCEGDEPMPDDALELLRRAEMGINVDRRANAALNPPGNGAYVNDGLQIQDENGESSNSSLNAKTDSSANSSIIQRTINEAITARSSASDLSSAASRQQPLYPDFAECIRKTMEDAAVAEQEAIQFLRTHSSQQHSVSGTGAEIMHPPSTSTSQQQQMPLVEGDSDQKKQKGRRLNISRFFR